MAEHLVNTFYDLLIIPLKMFKKKAKLCQFILVHINKKELDGDIEQESSFSERNSILVLAMARTGNIRD